MLLTTLKEPIPSMATSSAGEVPWDPCLTVADLMVVPEVVPHLHRPLSTTPRMSNQRPKMARNTANTADMENLVAVVVQEGPMVVITMANSLPHLHRLMALPAPKIAKWAHHLHPSRTTRTLSPIVPLRPLATRNQTTLVDLVHMARATMVLTAVLMADVEAASLA